MTPVGATVPPDDLFCGAGPRQDELRDVSRAAAFWGGWRWGRGELEHRRRRPCTRRSRPCGVPAPRAPRVVTGPGARPGPRGGACGDTRPGWPARHEVPRARHAQPSARRRRRVPRGPRPVPLQAPQTCCSFRLERLPARGCPRVTARTSRGQTDVLWPALAPPPVDARARRRAPRHPAMLPSLAKPPFAVPGHVLNGRLPRWAATPAGAVSLLAHRGSPNFARACRAVVRGHTEAGRRAGQPGGSGGAPPGPGPPPRPPPAE